MKKGIFTVVSNEKLVENVYKMELKGDTTAIVAPGQFVNIELPGFYLRRPISVCDVSELSEEGILTLIYKVVGKGTDAMSTVKEGEKFDVLSGLGNGYDITVCGDAPVLVGGGVGVPPLYLLAKKLKEAGIKFSVVLGFNTKDEVFYEEEFKALCDDVRVTTVDGSYGIKGFVTNALPEDITYVYTCGPLPMFKALYNATSVSGQYSFEERMGCGFGACVGCTHKTVNGYKRICKDGPVLYKEEILWED